MMYSVSLFLLVSAWSAIAQELTCDPVTGDHQYCACKMSDGSGTIDISVYATNRDVLPRFIGKDDNFEYLYNPCYPVYVTGIPACTDHTAAGCQVIDDQNGHNIGQYNVVKFSVDPTTKDVNISYTEGDYNRNMIVTLKCNHNKTEPEFIVKGEIKPLQYYFILESKCSCPYDEFKPCTLGNEEEKPNPREGSEKEEDRKEGYPDI